MTDDTEITSTCDTGEAVFGGVSSGAYEYSSVASADNECPPVRDNGPGGLGEIAQIMEIHYIFMILLYTKHNMKFINMRQA